MPARSSMGPSAGTIRRTAVRCCAGIGDTTPARCAGCLGTQTEQRPFLPLKAVYERIVKEEGLYPAEARDLHDEISGQDLPEVEIRRRARAIKARRGKENRYCGRRSGGHRGR